jgi:hypothetical protein
MQRRKKEVKEMPVVEEVLEVSMTRQYDLKIGGKVYKLIRFTTSPNNMIDEVTISLNNKPVHDTDIVNVCKLVVGII